jgi:hypothetical protein
MTLHSILDGRLLERHRRNAAQRRNDRALARALATATSPAEIRDLRSLASR